MEKHIFAICAYKESKYLEECVISLINQTRKSRILIVSSTPSAFIDNIAKKYSIECIYREGKSDIKDDWNYACSVADAEWVTIAHQDDVYAAEYAEKLMDAVKDEKNACIAFTDYRGLIGGKVVNNINCKIRRFLLRPMRIKTFSGMRFWKRRVLSLGNSICCPGVTYHKSVIEGDIFTTELKFNIDWDTFYKYANLPGRFIYIKKPLVYYRVHDEATTMECIDNSLRIKEDNIMFEKFWPRIVVKVIMIFYKKAYDEYTEVKDRTSR